MKLKQLQKQELPMIEFTEKKQQRLKENKYAPLEPKTKKMLDKLKKRLAHFDEQITEKRLEESKSKIQFWINRHTAQRVIVNKDFKLFADGKNAAKMSRRIEAYREYLRNAFYESIDSQIPLKGRVKKTP